MKTKEDKRTAIFEKMNEISSLEDMKSELEERLFDEMCIRDRYRISKSIWSFSTTIDRRFVRSSNDWCKQEDRQ